MASHPAAPSQGTTQSGIGVSSTDHVSQAGPTRRTGVDNWDRPQSAPQGRVDQEEPGQPRQQAEYDDEPAYGPVLGFTVGWYAIPAVLYLIWLFSLSSDQRGFSGRDFVASLPWLSASVALSLAVAALLRWGTVGWRTLTLSFAAAVIGAGVATIAHSLAG